MATFWIVVGALAAATFVGELILVRMGYGQLSLIVIVATGGIGVAFVTIVARPEPGTVPAPTPPSTVDAPDEEPFDDPVEAADRADSTPASDLGPPAPGTGDASAPAEPVDDGLE